MANKKTDESLKYNMKQINKLTTDMQNGLNSLYTSTYYNTSQNNTELDVIRKSIDNSISKITSRNYDTIGTPSVTHLFTRLQNSHSSNNKFSGTVEELFGDDQKMMDLISSVSDQNNIREADIEIDCILRYMPKLQEALDTKKENVLCSDSFGKDFLNARNKSKTGEDEEAKFVEELNNLKRLYNLSEFYERCYDNISKYGEEFVYISPYKKEFAKLLNSPNRKGIFDTSSATATKFSIGVRENGFLSITSGSDTISCDSEINEAVSKIKNFHGANFILESGIIKSVYREAGIINEARNKKFDVTIDNDLELDDFKEYDKTSNDGFIDQKKISEKAIKVNGCIIKKLPRDRVIPIYIEDTCLGYYYFEIPRMQENFGVQNLRDPLYAMKNTSNTSIIDNESNNDQIEMVIQYLSNQLTNVIDAKFIEANADIRREIYMIMKHNDIFNSKMSGDIKVTFIPPENVHHLYFKFDEKTHRGVSDLDKSLLPAKLYSSLYLTNTIGVLTRGQDKRVYYIKQTVDSNISASLINAINQIKKSNFGLREVNSIGQILNITGRYNDYFIPTNQGDSPIQFEVMQGQNIDIKSDLLEILEEMAVNATDVPLEVIQARQSMDYATQYVMSNSKFYRKILKRQSICNRIFSRMTTSIYNYEYETNDIIEVTLPVPLYLKMNAVSSVIDNAKTYVEAIADYEYPDSNDEAIKGIFRKKLMRYQLQAHVDQDIIDKLKKEAEKEQSLVGNNEE